MKKLSSLACAMAAMLHLSIGIAVAADTTEAAQPTTTNTPENPSKPKEDTPSTSSSKNTTPSKEEPDCN